MIDAALLAAILEDPRPGLVITGDALVRERVWQELALALEDRGHRVRSVPAGLSAGELDLVATEEVIMVAAAELIEPEPAVVLARRPAVILSAGGLDALPAVLVRRCCAVVHLPAGVVSLRNLLGHGTFLPELVGVGRDRAAADGAAPGVADRDPNRGEPTDRARVAGRDRIAAAVVELADRHGIADHGLELGAARLAELMYRTGTDPRPLLIDHVFGPRAATATRAPAVPDGAADHDQRGDGDQGGDGDQPGHRDRSGDRDRGREGDQDGEPDRGRQRDRHEGRDRDQDRDGEATVGEGPDRHGAGPGTRRSRSARSDESEPTAATEPLPTARPEAAIPPPRARVRRAPAGRRGAVITGGARGRPGRVVPYGRRGAPLALLPTLRTALPWQQVRSRGRDGRVIIAPEDLRGQLRRRRAGRLTIMIVDASGSMGRDAVRTAKALALGLLDAAYQRRDEVAIVLARGSQAVLGLAPTRSRVKALQCLRRLQAGGGTPLASALLLAAGLADRYDPPAVELVIFTDGRANVGVGGDPREDAAQAARLAARRCGSVRVIPPARPSRYDDGWLIDAFASATRTLR